MKAADPPHVARAFAAATSDWAVALVTATSLAELPAGVDCPRVAHTGTQTAITGGCTAADGSRYDGQIVIDSVRAPGDEQRDPNLPLTLELDGFRMRSRGGFLAFDGSLSMSSSGIVLDAAITIGDISSVDDVSYVASDGDGGLAIGEGSSIDVDQLGSFDVRGDFALGDPVRGTPGRGSVSLTGAQTLTVDLSRTSGRGCLVYQIDGADAGAVCTPDAVQPS